MELVNLLTILYYAASFILLLITLVVLTIVVYHLRNKIKEKKYSNKKKKWEHYLFKYLAGEITIKEAAGLMDSNYFYLYDFIKPYLKNLKGDDFEKIKKLLKENGMNKFFLEKLKNGRKDEKIKAAVFLGKIKSEKALPLLEIYLDSDNKDLQTVSIWAVADIGARRLFFKVLKLTLKERRFTFEILTEILIRFGRDICGQIEDFLKDNFYRENKLEIILGVPEYQVLALFYDIFGYFRYYPGVQLMEPILTPDCNDEVLIHIFKALVKMEYPVDKDLSPFLKHDNWVVRSQAARYTGVIKAEGYLEELLFLISDSNWWVRYYSAWAILKTGQIDVLKDIIKSEKKGKEMSKYVLAQNNI